MGHDEVYKMGICPVCKTKNPADLFRDDILTIYNYLKAKNLGMMIWSDMLQPANANNSFTPLCIDEIPRDIIMLEFIWYFNFSWDIEAYLLEKGFRVMMGNMYSSHYPRYEKRAKPENLIGAEVSTWIQVSEESFGFEGKMYDLVYSANMIWSDSYDSDFRLSYNEIVKKLLLKIKKNFRNTTGKAAKFSEFLPKEMNKPLGYALSEATRKYNIQGVFKVDKNVKTIKINKKLSALSFDFAADKNEKRIAWKDAVNIANFKVKYEDNSEVNIPVDYGRNIMELGRVYAKPYKSPYYRHQGYVGTYICDPVICDKDDAGNDITVYRFIWDNPCPDKEIIQISAQSAKDTDVQVMLFDLM